MAISIDWSTYVISVPQADLTPLGGTLYELDANDFRLWLADYMDDSEGRSRPDVFRHNTEVVLGGLTFARIIEILFPYTITFEDGQYTVLVVGANSNIEPKTNQNQVSVRQRDSAGLIVVTQGSGVTSQDKTDIANLVYSTGVGTIGVDAVDALALSQDAEQTIADGLLDRAGGAEVGMTLRQWLRLSAALFFGKTLGLGTTLAKFRDVNDTKDRVTVTFDGQGDRTGLTLTPD